MVIETNQEKETYALGVQMGQSAKPGAVYTLVGDLGVGKTVFTQGFASGLGVDEPVNSPTFTIVQIMKKGACPSIILMSIVLAMWKKWMRSATKIIFTEKALA